MVFVTLIGFFAGFFEHRRCVTSGSSGPCTLPPSSSTTSSPASSSLPRLRSSTPATAGYIGIFYPTPHCAPQPSRRLSLLVPQTLAHGWALSLARPVLATPVRAFIPDAFPGLANPVHASSVAASIASSASTFYLNDCLDCITVFFPGASLRPVTMAPPCARGFMCGYFITGNPDYGYVDHGYLTHGIFDHGYSPRSRLPRHRHKGLPSA